MDAGAAGFSSTHSPTHFDSADRPVPSPAVEPRRAQGARRGGRPRRRRLASPTCPARPSAASRPTTRQLLIEMSLLSRHAGDHPGPRRPLEGRRAHRRLGQRQALRRRGHRPGRRRVLDGDVEAVQPHLQPRRRHQALRGRAAAQPPLHRGVDGRRSGSRSSPTRRSATPSATRSTTRTAIPTPGPRCRRRAGRCCTSTR